ncbi:PIN domain-containing protein, partial [Streptomyces sp. NPDC088246]|uniref:PIN domain-containing protein n=1 Tax=Streptomyces sp. NPDC088246 TaxID=3365842 RepID=UPI00382BCBB7
QQADREPEPNRAIPPPETARGSMKRYRTPSKKVGGDKTGARDAAVWLTAVEYAREHPDETVYFVSEDSDFGDGSSFGPPMVTDVQGLGDKFVFLSSLDDVLTKFAVPSEVDDAELKSLLTDPRRGGAVARNSRGQRGFSGAVILESGQLEEAHDWVWVGAHALVGFNSVSDARAFEIAGHRWYTATVRWLVSGRACQRSAVDIPQWVNCSLTTRVLLSPTAPSKRLAIIDRGRLLPITAEDIDSVPAHAPGELAAPQGLRHQHKKVVGEAYRLARPEFLQLSEEGYVGSLAHTYAIEKRMQRLFNERAQGQYELPEDE